MNSTSAKLYLPEEDIVLFNEIRVQMLADGTKVTTENLLAIWKLCQSIQKINVYTLFLETGVRKAGYLHILRRHEQDFADFDIASPCRAISNSICENHIPHDDDLPGTLSIICDDSGEQVFVFCCAGTKGFVVTAFPVGLASLKRFFRSKKVELRLPDNLHSRYHTKKQALVKLFDSEKEDGPPLNPNSPQDPRTSQIYVVNAVESYLYVSFVGRTDHDLFTHELFSDQGLLSKGLIDKFKSFNQSFHDSIYQDAGDESPVDTAWNQLRALDLAYSLKVELEKSNFKCKIYGEFDMNNDDGHCVEATGRNLRLARRLVIDGLLNRLTEIDIVYSQEFSSSNVGQSSSPRKSDLHSKPILENDWVLSGQHHEIV